MATTLLSSTISSPISDLSTPRNRDFGGVSGFPKTPFLPQPNLLPSTSTLSFHQRRVFRRFQTRSVKDPYSYIPKQFREENLADGLMDNFKNVPKQFYGLNPSQMNMFITEDSHIMRQGQKVTEESISSARNYLDNSGMYSISGMNNRPSIYSMSASMFHGGGRGYGRRRSAPPDLPSLLLDARICYLGMPIVPAVAELIIAQLMWLDYEDPAKPIYLYINSPGTQNNKRELVASDTDAYAIANSMLLCKSKIYTVNLALAGGQAAMILSLGTKGFRALQPHATTKLLLPKMQSASGTVADMWVKAKELDAVAGYYIELLARGTGKPKEEIAKDIQHGKHLRPQGAIDYGIADKIVDMNQDKIFDKKDYEALLAQSRLKQQAMRDRAAALRGEQPSPSLNI